MVLNLSRKSLIFASCLLKLSASESMDKPKVYMSSFKDLRRREGTMSLSFKVEVSERRIL